MSASLLNCHSCGHQVSPQAESCPKCGQPFKVGRKTSVARGVFWGLFAFFILLPIGVTVAVFVLAAVSSGISASAKARSESVARQQENDSRRAKEEQSRADARRLIEETKAKEEFEKTPEGIAAREKEEAEQKKITEENERLRIEHMQAVEEARMRPIREQESKILAYQLDRASNGYPSYQVLIGKRYLTGDGVETNLALARHWLQSACTNGEPQATNLLIQLSGNSR